VYPFHVEEVPAVPGDLLGKGEPPDPPCPIVTGYVPAVKTTPVGLG
jgi:hypothetical protein